MNSVTRLRGRLNAHRHTGAWRHLAREAGCAYDTLSRVARGAVAAPNVLLCDRLHAAMDRLEAGQAAEASAAAAQHRPACNA